LLIAVAMAVALPTVVLSAAARADVAVPHTADRRSSEVIDGVRFTLGAPRTALDDEVAAFDDTTPPPVISGVRFTVAAAPHRRERGARVVLSMVIEAMDADEHHVAVRPLLPTWTAKRPAGARHGCGLFEPESRTLKPGRPMTHSRVVAVSTSDRPSWIEVWVRSPNSDCTRRIAVVEVGPARRGAPSVKVVYERP